MRGAALVAGLLLAAAASSVAADKDWNAWYWSDFDADAAEPTTFDVTDDFTVAHNLWFHVQRFFAVLPPEQLGRYSPERNPDVPFSQNIAAGKLPFADPSLHFHNIQAGVLRGTCLWIDFPFPAFPENMGHWAEVLLPVYSALVEGAWAQRPPQASGNDWNATAAGGGADGGASEGGASGAGGSSGSEGSGASSSEGSSGGGGGGLSEADAVLSAVIFPNLRREQVKGLTWVMDMLKLTLKPGLRGRAMPRVLFFDELEALNATAWLGFQRVLMVRTRYSHPEGRSGFAKPEHADAFRQTAYAAANVTLGGPAWEERVPPPTITYLMAMNHEPVVNNGEVLEALREVGDALGLAVRPYSVTPGAAFPSFVASMAKTGVLVARHGPLLANAMFLPPGAVVLELLPYNWEWHGISEIYLNLTRSVGGLHHFAWKANSSEWVMYLESEDAKYSHWTSDECSSRYCLEAHARAGMIVDTDTVKRALLDVLPRVLKGESVPALAKRVPWPRGSASSEGTGLFWDID
ncbi:hypothetical protein C2E20_1509 [Micractinium conductrix]|uniref:EGF domain-specific O-linked N-acetylglucosamine transferase n=1 Tax=Micractinium conductrix TaxID=554055 RepID=A0A2P6VNE3_9CHLO|nr:hypothetical protein C2E20_1509 [Micractinium conductrix]|eukprot:PSC75577.1 hypothetical protein C2E20_1509 [Micractinium conductrix]